MLRVNMSFPATGPVFIAIASKTFSTFRTSASLFQGHNIVDSYMEQRMVAELREICNRFSEGDDFDVVVFQPFFIYIDQVRNGQTSFVIMNRPLVTVMGRSKCTLHPWVMQFPFLPFFAMEVH